jgi:hypothetical protein
LFLRAERAGRDDGRLRTFRIMRMLLAAWLHRRVLEARHIPDHYLPLDHDGTAHRQQWQREGDGKDFVFHVDADFVLQRHWETICLR